MPKTVADMTPEEFKEVIGTIIEEKLREMLGDPDAGLPLRKAMRDRLRRQKAAVAAGERGESLAEVTRRLGLE